MIYFFIYKYFNCNLKIFKNELLDRQCLLSIKQCLSLNKAKIDIFLKSGRYIELKNLLNWQHCSSLIF